MMWDLRKYGGLRALISQDGVSLSYDGLHDSTEAIAGAMGERDLVFLLCTNTVGSVAGYLACLNHDIVPLLLPSAMDPGQVMELAERYRPGSLWLPEEIADRYEGEKVFEMHGYCLLRLRDEPGFPMGEELALLLTTSGSTGSPKLVRQSRKNIISNASIHFKHVLSYGASLFPLE